MRSGNLLVKATLSFALLISAGQGFAADICRDAAGRADYDLNNLYGRRIDFLLRVAAGAQAHGIDPTRFPQPVPGGNIEILNLPWLAQQLALQRDNALRQVISDFQACEAGWAPYQQIVNNASFYMTGGLSAVLPPAVSYIDLSRITSGTPLGGQNALIPKAREDILNGLGIGGDVAKVIRNPVCIFGC